MDDMERELFDGPGETGSSDPELRRLEGLLGRYRYAPEPFAAEEDDTPDEARAPRGATRGPWRGLALAAAVLLVAWAGWTRFGGDGRDSWITTARGETRRVDVGAIGFVELLGGSRFRVDPDGDAPHSYYLEEGALRASILAPPRAFQIGTPMGLSVDLGCEYEIELGEETARLEVTTGLVLFGARGREVRVPAGYACLSSADLGPCAPVPAGDHGALLDVWELERSSPTDGEIGQVLGAADPVTLWNLLAARDPRVGRAAGRTLAEQVPLPAGLTLNEVRSSEGARLRWRDAIPAFRFEPVLEDLWEPESSIPTKSSGSTPLSR